MSTINLELAGFLDDQGRLGRPVPSGQVLIPSQIWLEGDALRWRRGSTARLQEASPNMLSRFISLTDADSILHFAKMWGVLALQLPETGGTVLRPGRDMKDEGCEPIAAWQYYIRRVRAVLNIAAAIKQKKLGDLADWEQIGTVVQLGHYTRAKHESLQALFAQHKFGMGWHVLVQQDTLDENLANARVVLAGEISAWLDCWKPGRPRGISDFVLQWSQSQERWELLIDFHGLLFPAIAFQLALVVAEADSLYSCSGCGLPYVRARDRKRPKRGCANYCAGCAEKGVDKRRAGEDYREKKAAAAGMHRRGVPIPEIAAQLQTDASRVQRWLERTSSAKDKDGIARQDSSRDKA